MQQPAHPTTTRRTPRNVAGILAIAAGAILTTVGISTGPALGEELPPTQTVPLNNIDAPTENTPECPNAIDDFWHFVIAGGQGYSFVSITLNLDGDSVTFTGTEIIPNPNNGKLDNVYVMVPDGYTFADLEKDGSSAEITPDEGSVNFVLSHFCDGPGRSTTTTTTLPATSTTVAETSTTVAETSTTVAETSTTVAQSTTTVAETSTTVAQSTTTLVGSQGPTTTTTVPEVITTTTQAASAAATTTLATELPRTGSDLGRSLAILGGLLVVIGGVLLLTARRSATS